MPPIGLWGPTSAAPASNALSGGSAPSSSPDQSGVLGPAAANAAGASSAQGVQTGLYNTQQSTSSLNLTSGPSASGNGAIGNTDLSQSSQGSITNVMESPAAIAALSAGTQSALNASTAQLQSGFQLAGQLGTTALQEAQAALTPADQRIYTTIEWVAGLVVVGLIAFYFLRRS